MFPSAYAFRVLSLPHAQMEPSGGNPPPRHGSGLDLEHLMFTRLLVRRWPAGGKMLATHMGPEMSL